MAQLDQYLGCEVVQHRELMGHESKKFLKLFPAITVLEGDAGESTGIVPTPASLFHFLLSALQCRG